MTMREEPECIKKWKVEQEEMLKKKDADEEVKMTQEIGMYLYMYETGEGLKRSNSRLKMLVDVELNRSNLMQS